MKNSFKILIYILFLSSSVMVFGQTDSWEKETAAMDCFYTAFKDNGAAFKKIISNTEKQLIAQKLLKNASGESYLELYKNLGTLQQGDVENSGIQDYILNVMNGRNEFTFDTFKSCTETMRNKADFEESRINKNTNFIKSLRKGQTSMHISEIRDTILKRFTAKDFEHDYYKLMTFTLLDSYFIEAEMVEVDLNKKPSAEEMEAALKIELQPKEDLFINSEKTLLASLRKKVKAYLKEKKSESLIVLKYDLKIEYKFFINVQNEMITAFEEVRNELATQKFKRSFDELSQAQQEEIKKTYPMKIVD